MICPECDFDEGLYSDIEDFNPGADEFGQPEWSYYTCWMCLNCHHTVYSYEAEFKYEDE